MSDIKVIVNNKRAFYDYFLEDFTECGIELKGSEIKSLRKNGASLRDSYVVIRNNEAYLLNMHISIYEQGNIFNHDTNRTRKLLLHKKEIIKLGIKAAQKVLTIVPTKVYLKKGRAKVEIALAKGKKLYDKREVEKAKEDKRNISKVIKNGGDY